MGFGKWGGLFGLVISCSSLAAIFGEDDRREWFAAEGWQQQAARRVGALVSSDLLEAVPDGFRLSAATPLYKDYFSLCPGVRFAEQPSPADCSGFYVGGDSFITARHCFNKKSAAHYRVVFDFYRATASAMAPTFFHRSQVSQITKVSFPDGALDGAPSGAIDAALLTLDRTPAVSGLVIATADPAVDSPLVTMGFPHGIPLKIAGGGKVTPNTYSPTSMYFEADLDVFGGNSGSPVFSPQGTVVGMLLVAFGEFDREESPVPENACQTPTRYESAADGTTVWILRPSFLSSLVLP